MFNYYFTFGIAHENADYYQMIVAENEVIAHQKMFEVYGKEWGLPYDQSEWEKASKSRHVKRLKPLETIITEREMKIK